MIYITQDDLKTQSYQRFIDESSADFPEVLDNLELENSMLLKTYLAGRFDVNVIFDGSTALSNALLVRILTAMVLHDLFKRNAARKLPADIEENYKMAMKLIGQLQQGIIRPGDLPAAPNTPPTLWGNNKNEDFYI